VGKFRIWIEFESTLIQSCLQLYSLLSQGRDLLHFVL
jgi:hypothetical protein